MSSSSMTAACAASVYGDRSLPWAGPSGFPRYFRAALSTLSPASFAACASSVGQFGRPFGYTML